MCCATFEQTWVFFREGTQKKLQIRLCGVYPSIVRAEMMESCFAPPPYINSSPLFLMALETMNLYSAEHWAQLKSASLLCWCLISALSLLFRWRPRRERRRDGRSAQDGVWQRSEEGQCRLRRVFLVQPLSSLWRTVLDALVFSRFSWMHACCLNSAVQLCERKRCESRSHCVFVCREGTPTCCSCSKGTVR